MTRLIPDDFLEAFTYVSGQGFAIVSNVSFSLKQSPWGRCILSETTVPFRMCYSHRFGRYFSLGAMLYSR